jgi:uncharacterized protein YerC
MTHAKNPGRNSGVDCAAVVREINKGTKYAAIAKRHGCSITMVHNIARVYGTKPRQRTIGQELVDQIVAAAKAGETYVSISKRLGVSNASVQRLASKVGMRRIGNVSVSPYLIEQAYKNGRSARAIATELGVCPKTVCRRLRVRGVKLLPWKQRVSDDQIRACAFARMTPNAAARKLGIKPSGHWYRRWARATAAKAVSA